MLLHFTFHILDVISVTLLSDSWGRCNLTNTFTVATRYFRDKFKCICWVLSGTCLNSWNPLPAFSCGSLMPTNSQLLPQCPKNLSEEIFSSKWRLVNKIASFAENVLVFPRVMCVTFVGRRFDRKVKWSFINCVTKIRQRSNATNAPDLTSAKVTSELEQMLCHVYSGIIWHLTTCRGKWIWWFYEQLHVFWARDRTENCCFFQAIWIVTTSLCTLSVVRTVVKFATSSLQGCRTSLSTWIHT